MASAAARAGTFLSNPTTDAASLAAFFRDEAPNDFGDRLVLAGPRDGEPVVERKARHGAGGGGNRRGGSGGDVEEAVERAGREHGQVLSAGLRGQPTGVNPLHENTETVTRLLVLIYVAQPDAEL